MVRRIDSIKQYGCGSAASTVSSFCHTIFFCLLLTESTALSCTVVFNENVTINSWELELKIKPRLNWNSLVCHDTPSEA